MKKLLVIFFIFSLTQLSAQTFAWTSYPTGGTSYTTGIMTATITSSAPGFQNSTPRHYAAATVGSGQCGIAGGLALEQLFGNVTSAHVTLTMNFTSGGTTNGTCASMQFQIRDINADESVMTFRDFVHISAIDGNNVAIPVANITATGGSNKTITTSGGTTRIIAGSSGSYGSRTSTACDNVTITVTPPAGVPLRSITLRYQPSYEAASATTGYWNFTGPYRPAYQYISISGLTATSTVGCVVLPVQLSSFTGACKEGKKHFSWTTLSELNSSAFILEGSADGESYESLVEVPAAGTTNFENNYSVIITDAENKFKYFRLKQTDTDGRYEYSNSIMTDCDDVGTIAIFPNPFQDEITVQFSDVSEEEIYFSLYDISGAKISEEHRVIQQAEEKINLSTLPKGVYYLFISNGKGKISQREKIIKN